MSDITDIALLIAEEVEQAYLDNEFEDVDEVREYIQEKAQELSCEIQEAVESFCGSVFRYLSEDEDMRREDQLENLAGEDLMEIFKGFKAARGEDDG